MTSDMLQLISLVTVPGVPRLFAFVLLFALIISVKHHFPKE